MSSLEESSVLQGTLTYLEGSVDVLLVSVCSIVVQTSHSIQTVNITGHLDG